MVVTGSTSYSIKLTNQETKHDFQACPLFTNSLNRSVIVLYLSRLFGGIVFSSMYCKYAIMLMHPFLEQMFE